MPRERTVLVIDRDRSLREFVEVALAHRYRVLKAGNPREARDLLAGGVTVVLAETAVCGDGGELLEAVAGLPRPHPLVVMMTSFGSIDRAVAAMRRGAVDYITKPFGPEQLEHVIERARQFAALRRENRSLRENLAATDDMMGLVGNHPSIRRLRERIASVAARADAVLLEGESGTGKGLVARAIHAAGEHGDGPFLRFNCAAVPESLLEAELFGGRGHGAGGLARAAGGTLLLDDIDALPSKTQEKLLRRLQAGDITAPGQEPISARVIVATTSHLAAIAAAGGFNAELMDRLGTDVLRVVPLRERREDIPRLAAHFCRRFCAEHDRPLMRVDDRAMRGLMDMAWPGNVRQLRNAVERAVILGSGTEIDPEHLGLVSDQEVAAPREDLRDDLTLKEMERELILRKLERTSGNRTRAARELGISVRTLRNKLNLYAVQDRGITE